MTIEHSQLTREDDHDTSIEAAKRIEDDLRPKQRLVYQAHAAHPVHGLTDSELRAYIDAKLGFKAPESTYRKRRTELTDMGFIEATNMRRENAAGSAECVWRIVANPTFRAQTRKQSKLNAAVSRTMEACAKIAEEHGNDLFEKEVGRRIAAIIRARMHLDD